MPPYHHMLGMGIDLRGFIAICKFYHLMLLVLLAMIHFGVDGAKCVGHASFPWLQLEKYLSKMAGHYFSVGTFGTSLTF